jgi:hypothetical protein
VGRGVALLRKRSWLVAVGAIAATGLLLGVAIGYTVAHRRASGATATEPGRGLDTVTSSESGFAGVRESVSAGGIAPLPNASRRAATRTPPRPAAAGQRPAARAAAPRVEARPPAAAAAAPPPVNRPAVEPALPAPTVDSSAVRARRDSLARAESLAAERDAIRQEIERRRARLDSIQRTRARLDSIERANAAGNRPPR